MSKKETCPVQECNITIVNRFIECPECKFKACINCYKHFMMNENSFECMSCKKAWNDDFIDSIFPKTFIKKELKTHRENLMFETQEAMFTETLDYLNKQNEIDIITKKIVELNLLINKYKNDIFVIQNMNRLGFPTHLIVEEEKKKVFVTRHCPIKECQGYLDRNYTCSGCKVVVCTHCEIIKDDNNEHVCDPNDVASVKLKVNTSKPCPKCSKLTFKIDGCSQVWCPPPCGTAWNFNTGTLDKGPVHSPDYYDYMRKNNNGVVPPQNFMCANNVLPDIWIMQRRVENKDFEAISEIHRFFVDLRNHVMYRYDVGNVVNDFDKNLDLRVKFLTNLTDKESFKKTLFSRNKKTNKHKTIYENLNMLYIVGVDIFHKIRNDGYPVNKTTGLVNLTGAFDELNNIRKYYNEVIIKTKERYDCKSCDVSKVTSTWKFSY